MAEKVKQAVARGSKGIQLYTTHKIRGQRHWRTLHHDKKRGYTKYISVSSDLSYVKAMTIMLSQNLVTYWMMCQYRHPRSKSAILWLPVFLAHKFFFSLFACTISHNSGGYPLRSLKWRFQAAVSKSVVIRPTEASGATWYAQSTFVLIILEQTSISVRLG